MAWEFSTPPEYEDELSWMRQFVRNKLVPLEELGLDRRTWMEIAKPLKEEVKERGLWAAHLSPELGGQGFGQVKLALMHEIMGRTEFAPTVFGAQAPDSGNSELLAIGGTAEQKKRWLEPLLAGEMYSSFSMTELGRGSDPRQFTTRAVRDGDDWIINGSKWFISNAAWADFHIVMVVTDPDVDPYKGMSMIIVPSDAEGVSLRPLGVMSDPHAQHPVHSQAEVHYTDVRVPVDNMLGGEGDAFVLAQKRLGPGRIHHAMRWLGVTQRAFDMLCERAVSVSVHGSSLAKKQNIQEWVAELAARMEASRLLTLQTAWKIDTYGASASRQDISMIKYFGPSVMHDVLDKAIQIHGSLGFSTDMPLEAMYRWARASRIYDGPDEVHKMSVGKKILAGYEPVDSPSEDTRRTRALGESLYRDLISEVS